MEFITGDRNKFNTKKKPRFVNNNCLRIMYSVCQLQEVVNHHHRFLYKKKMSNKKLLKKKQHDLNINSQIEFICLMSREIYAQLSFQYTLCCVHEISCQINVFDSFINNKTIKLFRCCCCCFVTL